VHFCRNGEDAFEDYQTVVLDFQRSLLDKIYMVSRLNLETSVSLWFRSLTKEILEEFY